MYAKQLAECLPHNKPQTEKGKKKKKKTMVKNSIRSPQYLTQFSFIDSM